MCSIEVSMLVKGLNPAKKMGYILPLYGALYSTVGNNYNFHQLVSSMIMPNTSPNFSQYSKNIFAI
jgi:hypothetical protein